MSNAAKDNKETPVFPQPAASLRRGSDPLPEAHMRKLLEMDSSIIDELFDAVENEIELAARRRSAGAASESIPPSRDLTKPAGRESRE